MNPREAITRQIHGLLESEVAASVPEVRGVVDRLRVAPGERRAEMDAWYLSGVDRVINRLQVTS